MDRLAGADLEVGPAQFVFDEFIILLDPAAQPVQDDTIRQRPTLRTADKKVTTAGRPDAVGV
ncbi:hypothetical protein P2Q00_06815 [Streptomyces coacervatus]|uniref:hypothetical protein n=1 Tax=Streptomyces coacervatus TaxID=647381 RepID=UPI0023DCC7EF|nr:hypothetical protein [Streptomyces coacervatus]MDF2265153.1 hypothetical protein [Streptomyces coacervatus]